MKKSFRKSYRIKKKKSIFRNRFFWIAILVLIIFGGIFYLVCFSSIFQIKDTRISGNQKIQTQDIENLIKERINQKLLFFPTKSIFLINSNEIVESLLEKFLQINQVNLERRLPATLIVEIQERVSLGVWCQNENCLLIDKTGVIFGESSPDSQLVIKFQGREAAYSLGQGVIEENLLRAILEIQEKLKTNLKIDAKEFVVPDGERINAKTSEDWEIYFNPTADINWQLTKLSLVLEKKIPPERRVDLEYIDLRFGNFAPYKYKNLPSAEP